MAERGWTPEHPASGHLILKWMLLFLNCFYWTLSSTSIIVGAFLFFVKEPVLRQYVDFVFDPAVFFMAIGCAIFLVATYGCVGAAREDLSLLRIYWLALLGLLVVAAAVAAFLCFKPTFSAQIRSSTDDVLRRAILHYTDDRNLKDLIDTLQSTLQCCGLSHKGYLDWRANPYFSCALGNYSREICGVPYSCCKKMGRLRNVLCGFDTRDTAKGYIPPNKRIFTVGCQEALLRLVKSNRVLVNVVSMLIVVSLAAGSSAAWMLMKWIRDMTSPQFQMRRSSEHFRAESRV